MARTIPAAQRAEMRREFFSRLTGDELAELARQISEKADSALSEAGAAAVAAAAAEATAGAAATPGDVDAAVAGLATEGYADGAAAAAVVGLASTLYVDGKFTGKFTGDIVVASVTPGSKVTISVEDGLITGSVEAVI